MNDNRTFKLFMVVLIIAIICLLAFTGLGPAESRIIRGVNELRTGIDIRGGISAIMEPVYEQGTQGRNIAEDLASAQKIIEDRLDAQGIFDRSVSIDSTNNRLIIDIPWAQNEKSFDPRAALNELGSTGKLTFQKVAPEDMYKDEKDIKPTGDIVLSGEDVQTAKYETDQNGAHQVLLTLKQSGIDKFSKATGESIGSRIAIFMDENCISAPEVKSQITSSNAVIQGGSFTFDSATALADKIRFGALPTTLKPVSVDSISAQLGKGALDVAVKAGIISFILVCAFMVFLYRLPGLTSIVALSGLLALQILVLANFNFSVTLPGIGGIILSIGMSVDANVIIFERIKEELKEGKSIRAAIEAGFKRAFVAILDSNVTTLITAVVLWILGTGPVKGFGITLFFGTLLSFLSAVTASKMMLQGITAFSFSKNKWLFGISGGKKNEAV